MTKTFKIGEYAVGGKIRVSIPKTLTNIKIDILDYNDNKLVNQYIYYSFDRIRIERDLFEMTSSYWISQITDWITKNWKLEVYAKTPWYNV
jgi:hypothetical protein